MNAKEYQKQAKRTVNSSLNKEELIKNFCLGLGGESGEILDLFKKNLFHGHELDETKIKHELGDVLWYVVNIASVLGFDIEDIMEMNIDKLQKRYPDGFRQEDSINRKV